MVGELPLSSWSMYRGQFGGEEATGEGQDYAEGADGKRRDADPEQLVESSLEADLEQEEDDADLGEQLGLGIDLVDAQDRGPGHHSAQNLADHRRLADPAEDLVAHLRRQQDREELEQDLGDMIHRRVHSG